MIFAAKRRWAWKVGLAFALMLVVFALMGALSPARADTTPAPPGGDYANQCQGDSAPAFSDPQLSFTNGLITSTNGHCLKFSLKGGTPTSSALITSGDPVTIYGVGGWKTDQPLQIWQSDPLPISASGRTWPLYLTRNTLIGPDYDINRQCRSVVKGNKANPVQAQPITDQNPYAFGPFVFTAPEVDQVSIINIRASVPNPDCTNIVNAATEQQGADGVLIVKPRPAVAQQCALQAGPCLLANPSVIYAGQSFTVTGYNYQANAQNNQVSFHLTSDLKGNACQVEKGSTLVKAAEKVDTPNFTMNLSAPPSPALLQSNFKNGVYTYQVVASTDPTCSVQTQQAVATIYVIPPVLNVPSQLTAQQKGTFQGASWLTGTSNNKTQPLNVGLYVGEPGSKFNCATATAIPTMSTADGSFSVPYTAPNITSDSGVAYEIRAVAYSADTPLPANACEQFANTTCQASQSSSSCPLIVASAPMQVVPKAVAVPPWVPILLSLLTLLSLLLLLLLLGSRRDEKEVILTEQDVTIEREHELVGPMATSTFVDSMFSRHIRVTREVIRVRDGKVLDKEVEDYDVFRDAKGQEFRRLRPVDRTAMSTAKRQPATV